MVYVHNFYHYLQHTNKNERLINGNTWIEELLSGAIVQKSTKYFACKSGIFLVIRSKSSRQEKYTSTNSTDKKGLPI
jgi:hypothetical protein